MKSAFGNACASKHSRASILLVALIGLANTSCKKKEPPPSASSQPPSSPENPVASTAGEAPVVNPAPSPQPNKALPPPTPAVAARAENLPRQNVIGQVDPELTAQLRTFIQKKNRLPESFAEFVTVRLDTIPRPPEGKKWVIDTSSLEVKAVSAK